MIRAVALWGMELAWRGQRDWEEEFEKFQHQALKKCVNVTHGSRRELVSQIAGVESLRMVLDTAQARLAGKMIKDPGALGDLWIENESGRNLERGRDWVDFGEPYFRKDEFTLGSPVCDP